MRVPFLDLKRNYTSIATEVNASIRSVLEKGNYILGEEVALFEKEFARYVGCSFGVGVSNGTSAITVALQAVGVREGDEVITAANTAIPTVTGIQRAGAVPVLVEPGEDDSNMNVSQLERVVTKKTKAVIPVHLYGCPCDMPSIVRFADSLGIRVVEDCAQAHGAEIDGRRAGSFGDVGCFSFYPTKNLGAYGDGGMIVTGSEDVARMSVMLRHHGQSVKDQHEVAGMCARLDELQAAVLRVKLKKLDAWNRRRIVIAERYLQNLRNVRKPARFPNRKSVYHLFVVRTPERDRVAQGLRERGIGTGVHYPKPVHLQDAFTSLGYKQGDFPLTEQLSQEVLSLPVFPELTEAEISWVIESMNELCDDS